jgi:hypothetical protein
MADGYPQSVDPNNLTTLPPTQLVTLADKPNYKLPCPTDKNHPQIATNYTKIPRYYLVMRINCNPLIALVRPSLIDLLLDLCFFVLTWIFLSFSNC